MKTTQKQTDLANIGTNVRAQRQKSGHTQASLAEGLDLSVAYISLIERGGRNPPVTTVVDIARVLGVPPAKLLQGVT